MALLDVAEVDRVDTTALVRNHWRLAMPQQRPLCRTEEWVSLDVRGTGAGAESAQFILDQEFPDKRFAQATETMLVKETISLLALGNHVLGHIWCTATFRERNLILEDIGKSAISVLALERSGSVKHLIDQDAKRPPINGTSVTATLNNLGSNVLLRPDKRIGSEAAYAILGVDCGERS